MKPWLGSVRSLAGPETCLTLGDLLVRQIPILDKVLKFTAMCADSQWIICRLLMPSVMYSVTPVRHSCCWDVRYPPQEVSAVKAHRETTRKNHSVGCLTHSGGYNSGMNEQNRNCCPALHSVLWLFRPHLPNVGRSALKWLLQRAGGLVNIPLEPSRYRWDLFQAWPHISSERHWCLFYL